MSGHLVTAVVPAFNASKTIRDTVSSVLMQSHANIDLLVVDDGSTDDTWSVVRSIRDPRLRIIRKENGGVSSARNTGIMAAKGDFVAFLDADDVWVSEKLSTQLRFMVTSNLDASQTAALFVDDELQPLHLGPCPPYLNPPLEVMLFRHLPAFPSTLLVRRPVFDEVGLFNEGLVILEDWEFAIRLARFVNFGNLDLPLTKYRVHPGNRSRDLDMHIAPGLKVLESIFEDPSLPESLRAERSRIYAAMYAMFAGGAYRSGHLQTSFRWALRAVREHPSAIAKMAALPIRRMKRSLSGRRLNLTGRQLR